MACHVVVQVSSAAAEAAREDGGVAMRADRVTRASDRVARAVAEMTMSNDLVTRAPDLMTMGRWQSDNGFCPGGNGH